MIKSKTHTVLFIPALLLSFFLVFGISTSEGADKKEAKCKLQFSIHGWSIFYETASGIGTITCDNG